MKDLSKNMNLISFLCGVGLGILIAIAYYYFSDYKVTYLTGYASLNANMDAIGFKEMEGDVMEDGYTLTTEWKTGNNIWSDSFPTCLNDSSKTYKVKLGVLKKVIGEFGEKDIVVSVECLN